ncbi:MAG: hypothetical protein R3E79_39655 [Caldilineaceae bacterium]
MPTVQPLLARAKADTTADAHQIAAQDMNAVMAEACKIYDNYLGIHFTSAGETFNICEQIA